MQIGLFFGSFNPLHIGHLTIAQQVLNYTPLQKVWFVVSPQSPFKTQSNLLPERQRISLVQTAIENNNKFAVCDIELHLPKPSFTIDTINILKKKYPQHSFSIIMGEDNLVHLHKWKEYEAILTFCNIYVYKRSRAKCKNGLDKHKKVFILDMPILSISSTQIRNMIKEKKSVKYLVPESIYEEVSALKFYKK